ncbi:protein serine/threonine phosphatase [Thalassoporum mexicanum PCC 7367]|nr:protein serine/threonine phosphatase [Pseudanabaena sp. PCC 7367]
MISCSSCGYANPAGHNFCQNCGSRLAEVAAKIDPPPTVSPNETVGNKTIGKNIKGVSDDDSNDSSEGISTSQAELNQQAEANLPALSQSIELDHDAGSDQNQNRDVDLEQKAQAESEDQPDSELKPNAIATTVQILRQPKTDEEGDRSEVSGNVDAQPTQQSSPAPIAPDLDSELELTGDSGDVVEQAEPVQAKNINLEQADADLDIDPDIEIPNIEIPTEPDQEARSELAPSSDQTPDQMLDPDQVPTLEIENLSPAAAIEGDRPEPENLNLENQDQPSNQELSLDPEADLMAQAELENPIDPLPPTHPDRQIEPSIHEQALDQSEEADQIDNLDENQVPTITGLVSTEPDTSDQPDKLTPDYCLSELQSAGLSDVGAQREHNEDAFWAKSQAIATESDHKGLIQAIQGVFILCDGMGGHESGEVASRTAIDSIAEGFTPFWQEDSIPGEQTLADIITAANQAIFSLNELEQRRSAARMGTTVVVLAVYDTTVAIAHVGDSRIYKITASELNQITQDHEVANQLIAQGVAEDMAKARPDAHQLTQALGPRANAQINPTVQFLELEQDTLFLLCSDGLSDNEVVEQYWRSHLLPLLEPGADLKNGVTNLINLGNKLNGHDNLSAIVVRCRVGSITN